MTGISVVTRGWNGYRNKSQHRKSTLEKKILPPFQQGFEPATFQSRVRRSNHWAILAPPSWVDRLTAPLTAPCLSRPSGSDGWTARVTSSRSSHRTLWPDQRHCTTLAVVSLARHRQPGFRWPEATSYSFSCPSFSSLLIEARILGPFWPDGWASTTARTLRAKLSVALRPQKP